MALCKDFAESPTAQQRVFSKRTKFVLGLLPISNQSNRAW